MTLDELPDPVLPDPILPAIGRPDPLANALKSGTEADCPRVPEDAASVDARAAAWYLSLKPQNHYHAWLVDMIAITSLRLERNGRIERRLRDRAVLRAGSFWDDDRRIEAEELGDRLAQAPSRVVNLLRRTPQGCDWMIARWARLARIADVEGRWDDAQRALAFDLLGARPEDRAGRPGEAIDPLGRPVEAPGGPAELARREVAGLLRRKQEVAPLDALDRTMARADYVDTPTPEVREIRRREASLLRQMKWYMAQLHYKSPHSHTDPVVYQHFLRPVGFDNEPMPAPAPVPEPEPEPAPEPAAFAPELASEPGPAFDDDEDLPGRRQAKLRKAESRRESRRRKLERLRA